MKTNIKKYSCSDVKINKIHKFKNKIKNVSSVEKKLTYNVTEYVINSEREDLFEKILESNRTEDEQSYMKINNNNRIYKLDKKKMIEIPWFQKILEGNFRETKDNSIITDFDNDGFETVLMYIYDNNSEILSEKAIINNFSNEYDKRMLYKYLGMECMVEIFDNKVMDIIHSNMYKKQIIRISWDTYHKDCFLFRSHDHSILWNLLGIISEISYYWLFIGEIIYFFHKHSLFTKDNVNIIILYPNLVYMINFILKSIHRGKSFTHRVENVLDPVFDIENYGCKEQIFDYLADYDISSKYRQDMKKYIASKIDKHIKKNYFEELLFDCIPLQYDVRCKYGEKLKYCIGIKLNKYIKKKYLEYSENLALMIIFTRYQEFDSVILDKIVSLYPYLFEFYDLYHLNCLDNNIDLLIQHNKNVDIIDPITELCIFELLKISKTSNYKNLFDKEKCTQKLIEYTKIL